MAGNVLLIIPNKLQKNAISSKYIALKIFLDSTPIKRFRDLNSLYLGLTMGILRKQNSQSKWTESSVYHNATNDKYYGKTILSLLTKQILTVE